MISVIAGDSETTLTPESEGPAQVVNTSIRVHREMKNFTAGDVLICDMYMWGAEFI
jgi:hypothetical protein